jgi:hypothetical protein
MGNFGYSHWRWSGVGEGLYGWSNLEQQGGDS